MKQQLLLALGRINGRFGKSAVHLASTGAATGRAADADAWKMRQQRRTPRYTTSLAEVPAASAR